VEKVSGPQSLYQGSRSRWQPLCHVWRNRKKNQPGIYIFYNNGKIFTLKKTPDLPTNIPFGSVDRSMLYLTVAPARQRDDGTTGNHGTLCRIPN